MTIPPVLMLFLLLVTTLSCKETSPASKLASDQLSRKFCENRQPTQECQELRPSSPRPEDAVTQTAKLLLENKNPALEFCTFYKNVSDCFGNNCSTANKLRLQGYQNVCERLTASSIKGNELTIGDSCSETPKFPGFAYRMRYCLQQSTHMIVTANATAPGQPCRSCAEAVEGLGQSSANLDAASGIIGAHSICAMQAGLSSLDGQDWGCFLRGFGYAFGKLEAADLGKRGSGPLLATGFCHSMMMGLLGAAERADFEKMVEKETIGSLCRSFRTGCLQNPNNNNSCISCPAFLDEPVWNKAFATAIGTMRGGVTLAFPNETNPVGLRVGLLGAFEHTCVSLIGRNELAALLKSSGDLLKQTKMVASEVASVASSASQISYNAAQVLGDKVAGIFISPPSNGSVVSADGRSWSCYKCRTAYRFESAKYYVKGGWTACSTAPQCGWTLENEDRKSGESWRQEGIHVVECGSAVTQRGDFTVKDCRSRTREEYSRLKPDYPSK